MTETTAFGQVAEAEAEGDGGNDHVPMRLVVRWRRGGGGSGDWL